MGQLTLVVVGTGVRSGPVKATLASQDLAIQFDIINPESDLTDLGLEWVEQPRPLRKATTVAGAPKLAKYQIKALFAGLDPQQSVELSLMWLKSMAHAPTPVALAYGRLASSNIITATGYWLIAGLSIHVLARQQGSNEATRAEATIDLTEANIPRWTRPASVAPPLPANNLGTGGGSALDLPATLQGSRTDTLNVGESLITVALRNYGTPNMWRAIAAANNIFDPRSIPAGTRLFLP